MLNSIKTWWPIIVTVLAVAFALGANAKSISDNSCDIRENNVIILENTDEISDVTATLVRIETDVEWVRYMLEHEIYGEGE